ncbi:hypothetical protein [Phytohabitans kaempferiae]|uniref:Uncharacterized protein n=1 Tax=Phytohabitans kaempferiae TaxID=1620943 RepID=A0ABV6MFM2_9ACTN
MIDPVMITVATTLTTKAAESLSDVGRSAFGKLLGRVRGQLDTDPEGAAALAAAQRHPDDQREIERLARALAAAARDDPAFAADLARLWPAVRAATIAASGGGVVNQVSGTVSGAVVQARDVSGGITFGAPLTSDARDGR